MANTEKIETNRTESVYFNQQFGSGFTTFLPMQIREVKFIFHEIDVSGLVLCTILSGDNVQIIDREIMENHHSYKLYKINNYYVIQPAGTITTAQILYDLFAQEH